MTDLERLTQWMLANSIPTGHGDDIDGLLEELTLWVAEMRKQRDHVELLHSDTVTRAKKAENERDGFRVQRARHLEALRACQANAQAIAKVLRELTAERDRYRAALEKATTILRNDLYRTRVAHAIEVMEEALGDE